MRFFIRAQSDAMMAINRCYYDADRGRTALAIARFQDLAIEIPENARILYAEGVVRRGFLGQGLTALELFQRAHELATTQNLKTDTAWFAACNAAGLARNAEEFRHWAHLAIRGRPSGHDGEEEHFTQLLRKLDNGKDYLTVLLDHLPETGDAREDAGALAAVLEVALLIGSGSKNSDLELRWHKDRALRLRFLDAEAQQLRGFEAFPPDERLALKESLREMKCLLACDPYDAEAWNYKAAWCGLLELHEEAIAAADQAIALRPHRYARPKVNKAYSLYQKGNQTEAVSAIAEALRDAELENSADEIAQARELHTRYSSPRQPPSWETIMPIIRGIIQTARAVSEAELAQVPWASIDRLSGTIFEHAAKVRGQQAKALVPMVAQLLGDFTPETAFCVALEMAKSSLEVVESCLCAALYLAAHSEGVQRRDAARFLILMFLFHRDSGAIRANYRQAVMELAAAAHGPMSQLDMILRKELERIHPLLPHLIADQEPVDEEGRTRANRRILTHLAGDPPSLIRSNASGGGGRIARAFGSLADWWRR
jgi:tetratricopeptide (TPR) repeat protein